HEFVETLGHARLQDQRRFHHGNAVRIAPPYVGHPFFLGGDYGRVHDAVEFFNAGGGTRASSWRGIAESGLGEFLAVNAAIGLQNLPPEVEDHLVVNRPPGLHQVVSDAVSLDQVGATGGEHLAHRCFAAGDTAGQADAQHVKRAPARAPLPAAASHAASAQLSRYWTSAWQWSAGPPRRARA